MDEKYRKCSLCKNDKLLNEDNFHFKSKLKNRFTHICKPCWKEYRKKHYEENKDKYLQKSKDWRMQEKRRFYEWLQTKSCKDCGNLDFRVLEFDHLKDKNFDIASKIGFVKLEILMIEINKCDIVCSNCHKIRTAIRGNFYSYLSESSSMV